MDVALSSRINQTNYPQELANQLLSVANEVDVDRDTDLRAGNLDNLIYNINYAYHRCLHLPQTPELRNLESKLEIAVMPLELDRGFLVKTGRV